MELNKTEPIQFFIPGYKESDYEEIYKEFSALTKCKIQDRNQRIYSINFRHDGEDWIAKVGKCLVGKVDKRKKNSNGGYNEIITNVSDPSIVLAIFPGSPFKVITNKLVDNSVNTNWEPIFYAGNITNINYFN